MGRINDIFGRLRAEGRTALMPFVTAGYPSLEVTARVLPAIETAGASIVEIGFPFSDPIADGPVIAASMHEALGHGVTSDDVFRVVAGLRSSTDLGLIAMVSQSIVERVGVAAFVTRAADAGFDGLIVPDADLETAPLLREQTDRRDMSLSMLVAPTSTPARLAALARASTGFVYLLARVGITGERDNAPEIADRVAAIRVASDLPVAAGFGISNRAHVEAVTRTADAAIVGTALVRRMGAADDPVAAARLFVSDLAAGLATRAARCAD